MILAMALLISNLVVLVGSLVFGTKIAEAGYPGISTLVMMVPYLVCACYSVRFLIQRYEATNADATRAAVIIYLGDIRVEREMTAVSA